MEVRPSGRKTEARDLQPLKALFPMTVTPSGNKTSVRDSQPEKASSPIAVTRRPSHKAGILMRKGDAGLPASQEKRMTSASPFPISLK